MPWELRGNCVHKIGSDEPVPGGCHDTREEALAHMRALYANEPSARTASVEQAPLAAGVALVAADTGRVLMIQRALIDGDPSGGKWEFPGGRLEPMEAPEAGAAREFAEEVGHPLPAGEAVATWLSPDGVYRGYVWLTPEEGAFPINSDPEDRPVADPDNPDGSNYTEACAWFDPADLTRGPRVLREECRSTPWRLLTGRGPAHMEETMAASAEPEFLVASVGAPSSAFHPTTELDGPTPFGVLADGSSVDGHLALWASCHTGFPGCVRPPREAEFPYFNLGEAETSDGARVAVGKVTVGGGHAGPELSWRTAAAHYDEAGAAVAVVRAVADEWGIRMPGALLSSATVEQVDQLRRSPPSGDWRRIDGRLRLVAALAVNVPGYPIPRTLVASGETESLLFSEDWPAVFVAEEAASLAASLGLDPASRAARIAAQILK